MARDERTQRQLDAMVAEHIADFAVIVCERCGLETTIGQTVDGYASGCLLCGHLYATTSPGHADAVEQLRTRLS